MSNPKRLVGLSAAVFATSASLFLAPTATAVSVTPTVPVKPDASACAAGSGYAGKYVNCADSQAPAVVGLIDAIVGKLGIALPIKLSDVAGAHAPFIFPYSRGTATVAGNGLTVSYAPAGGHASATGKGVTSTAISVGVLSGQATSTAAPLSAGVAIAVGPLLWGQAPTAIASAATLGAALAISSTSANVESTAFGGWASAVSEGYKTVDGVKCTAIYGTASVTGGGSCASVLFLFSKSQDGVNAPVVYSLKNPFSLQFGPLLGGAVPGLLKIAGVIGIPGAAGFAKAATVPIAPYFSQDIIRFEYGSDGSFLRARSDIRLLNAILAAINPDPPALAPKVATSLPPTTVVAAMHDEVINPVAPKDFTGTTFDDPAHLKPLPRTLTTPIVATETGAGTSQPDTFSTGDAFENASNYADTAHPSPATTAAPATSSSGTSGFTGPASSTNTDAGSSNEVTPSEESATSGATTQSGSSHQSDDAHSASSSAVTESPSGGGSTSEAAPAPAAIETLSATSTSE